MEDPGLHLPIGIKLLPCKTAAKMDAITMTFSDSNIIVVYSIRMKVDDTVGILMNRVSKMLNCFRQISKTNIIAYCNTSIIVAGNANAKSWSESNNPVQSPHFRYSIVEMGKVISVSEMAYRRPGKGPFIQCVCCTIFDVGWKTSNLRF